MQNDQRCRLGKTQIEANGDRATLCCGTRDGNVEQVTNNEIFNRSLAADLLQVIADGRCDVCLLYTSDAAAEL